MAPRIKTLQLDEDDSLAMIETEVAKLPDPGRAIFNLHVPPKDTPIDQAMASASPSGQ
jgi:Icc-related predicted phosphoesterase